MGKGKGKGKGYLLAGLRGRHEVFGGGDLRQQRLGDDVVVGRVVGVVPVVDHGAPDGAGFPPVVGGGEGPFRDGAAALVAGVVAHQAVGDRACGLLDGC